MRCKVCGAPCRTLFTTSEFAYRCTNLGSTGCSGKLPKPACIMSTFTVDKAGKVEAWRIYHPVFPIGGFLPKEIILCEYCGWYNKCIFCANSYPPELEQRLNSKKIERKLLEAQ